MLRRLVLMLALVFLVVLILVLQVQLILPSARSLASMLRRAEAFRRMVRDALRCWAHTRQGFVRCKIAALRRAVLTLQGMFVLTFHDCPGGAASLQRFACTGARGRGVGRGVCGQSGN